MLQSGLKKTGMYYLRTSKMRTIPDSNGFLWGAGIGLAVCVITSIGMYGWSGLKKEVEKDDCYCSL